MSGCLVFLPGLLCDATVWSAQVRRFSPRIDVIVADYGDATSIGEMADRALAAAPERFFLAGHSMGARVAIELTRQAPERVESLALFDTGVHGVRPSEREKRMALVALAEEQGMEALCDAWLPPMVHPARRGDVVFMAPMRAMVTRFTPERFAGQIRALLERPDAAAALRTIACPLLVGVGRQDEWAPVGQQEEIIEIASHGDLAIFEDAGHMAPFEAPAAVNDALAKWLDAAEQER